MKAISIIRKHLASMTVLSVLGLFVFGCLSTGEKTGEQKREANRSDNASENCEAKRVARQVKADLDITTLEQLMAQMPNPPSSQARQGDKRVITWTFSDGSKIIATFKPAGGEGSGRSLVLYSVDLQN